MISRLLALLAVLALAVSPLNAAAATTACAHMDEAATVAADGVAMAEMPCCDPDSAPAMDPACAAACFAMAGVVANLPATVSLGLPAEAWSPYVLASARILRDRAPPPLERPPRSVA